jgi:hypothetical protein
MVRLTILMLLLLLFVVLKRADGLPQLPTIFVQPAQLPCGKHDDVSTRKVETITASEWAEIPTAINIANFLSNNVGL